MRNNSYGFTLHKNEIPGGISLRMILQELQELRELHSRDFLIPLQWFGKNYEIFDLFFGRTKLSLLTLYLKHLWQMLLV